MIEYTEFEIAIKTLSASRHYCKNKQEADDSFLDEFLEMIESLNMQFGGGSKFGTGTHVGVIDFATSNITDLERKIYLMQKWLLLHPSKPIILRWRACSSIAHDLENNDLNVENGTNQKGDLDENTNAKGETEK